MSTVFTDFSKTQAVQQATAQMQQNNAQKVTVKDAIPASSVNSDTVELSNKKEKKGPIKKLKGFIAGCKKFFAAVSEYTKGTVKGLVSGAAAGSVVYTGGTVINWTRQQLANHAAKKAGTVAQTVKKLPATPVAIVVAAGALAANLWTASLNTTEKQSEIDMRWTGVETK